jgi:hypothetical protein
MPKLRCDFDCDAFTFGDFTQIVIDQELYAESPGRYRFTLAHEVGHIVLHRKVLEQQSLRSVKEWAEFHKNKDKAEYREQEKQADSFAGFLLMPEKRFKAILQENLKLVEDVVNPCKGLGLEHDPIVDLAARPVARIVAKMFDVSFAAATNKVKYATEFKRMVGC